MKREYIPIAQDKLVTGLVYHDRNKYPSTRMVFMGAFDNKYIFRLLHKADYTLLSPKECKGLNLPYGLNLIAFSATTTPYYKLQIKNI